MKRSLIKLILALLLVHVAVWGNAQVDEGINKLLKTVDTTTSGEIKTDALVNLCFSYLNFKPDSALFFGQQGLSKARSIGYAKGEITALNGIAAVYSMTGNSDKSLQLLMEAMKTAEEKNLTGSLQNTLGNMGSFYAETGENKLAINYYLRSLDIASKNKIVNNSTGIYYVYLGAIYKLTGQLDSALYYTQIGFDMLQKIKAEADLGDAFNTFGDIYAGKKQTDTALNYYYQAIAIGRRFNQNNLLSSTMLSVANLYYQNNNNDSALFYAKEALNVAKEVQYTRAVKEAAEFLTGYYKKYLNTDSAFKYTGELITAKDSLYSQEKLKNIKDLQFKEHLREQELQEQNTALKNRIKFLVLGGIILVFIIILVILWRNNRHKQKAYDLLRQQKAETDMQKEKAHKALEELKATQSQLIQSEKMASLGELTAGIAHEIQNPLNFVNNFSEVSNELIDEMNAELNKGDIEEAKAISSDIKQNLEKINHHGKRADAIVKGMLQHSRSSSGTKEPTDINALCEEYLRLAYHGLRAKDKSFNATLKTDFDESIGSINIIPQDIGRVILNLITNAFYVVDEKKKALAEKSSFENLTSLYEPTVAVSTKNIGSTVEIKVTDNGNGIPKNIIDKIFQPFFTTKPTGQGTGLGLSLSYDIVKAHGGELKVDTKEGEGSSFIIELHTK